MKRESTRMIAFDTQFTATTLMTGVAPVHTAIHIAPDIYLIYFFFFSTSARLTGCSMTLGWRCV